MRLEKVVCPEDETLPDDAPVEDKEQQGDVESAKVISLADLKKK